jgi:glucose/sorbosone dehydrogenase
VLRATTALALLLALAVAAPATAAPRLEPLSATFDAPVAVTAPPGDPSRLMVVQQGGTIALVQHGVKAAQPFLDVSNITLAGGERGLLSMAFPPDYAQTGKFYVDLTARQSASQSNTSGELQVREYTADASRDHADPATGRLLLAIQHSQADNHNAGQLQFTSDGLLWITTGDGGGANDSQGNSQNLGSLLGKLLRIDPHPGAGRQYTIPAGNPFGTEIWAYGLRNPWRFNFDSATGDLVIGDVGQDHHEEIDYAPAATGLGRGANYGWPCREGKFDNAVTDCTAANAVDPVIDQDHADGWRALIGGPVVHDPGLPTLDGRELYGDNSQPQARSVDLHNPASDARAGFATSGLSAFGTDGCGHVYAASVTDGTVSQIVDGTPSPCPQGSGGGAPPPPTTTGSARRCRLSVHVRGLRRVAKRRVLPLRVRANRACRVTVSARVKGVTRFRTAHRRLPAAKRVTVRLKLSRPAARKLRRALRHRSHVRVQLRLRGAAVRPLDRRARIRG